VRRQSAWPGNFKTIAWEPAGSFSVAGVLPWNLSSTKISAPSGSEEMETAPRASGAANKEAFEFAGESRLSMGVGLLGAAEEVFTINGTKLG
jgi:hypothetical protein